MPFLLPICSTPFGYYRQGRYRPLLPRPLRPCQNCGELVQEFHRGRCNACYQYWHTHSQERPARLWQR